MSTDVGRIAVVGLTSRTGAAVAARFLRRGWSVVGTIRRPETAAAAVDAIVEAAGGGRSRITVTTLDLADPAAIDRVAAEWSTDESLDGLVVAAAPFEEMPIDRVGYPDLVTQAGVQAAGPAMLAIRCRGALARGRRGEGGAVVVFGDVHARARPRPGALPYLAGKAMLESMVPLLAIELAPVRIFGIAPGVIAWADGFDASRRASYLERVPLGRAGTLDEAAVLVESMIEAMTYTTGIVVPIDGGRSLR